MSKQRSKFGWVPTRARQTSMQIVTNHPKRMVVFLLEDLFVSDSVEMFHQSSSTYRMNKICISTKF